MEPLSDRIEHDGLVLRTWTEVDIEAMAARIAANADHLRPFMAWIAFEPLSFEDRLALVRGWEEQRLAGSDVIYGIFDEGTAVGGTGLHHRLGPGGLEIGYWVAADHLGRGIARRVSEGLTTYAFTRPDIDRVEIRHDVANVHSRGVPEGLAGYRCIGEDVPNRDTRAPAETGTDLVWRTTRAAWLAAHPD